MFGAKQFPNDGRFPTPEDVPVATGTRALCVPSSTAWFALVMGCLMLLADEANWIEQPGGINVEDAAAAAQDIIDNAYDEICLTTGGNIPTPYWDEVTDTDDEFPTETQPWYGYVTDPDLPPGELTFVESAGIWAFTGLLAGSGTPAAAMLFNTTAPSFVLAMRGDSFAEVIRVLVDGEDAVELTTTGDPDELVELPIFPDPDLSTHDILIILRELL